MAIMYQNSTNGKYADDDFIDLFKEAEIEFEMRDRPSFKITYLD